LRKKTCAPLWKFPKTWTETPGAPALGLTPVREDNRRRSSKYSNTGRQLRMGVLLRPRPPLGLNTDRRGKIHMRMSLFLSWASYQQTREPASKTNDGQTVAYVHKRPQTHR